MKRLEILFDYGAWAVENVRRGRFVAYHEWLIVALWRTWRRSQRLPQRQMESK